MDEVLPLITASEANARAWTEPILLIAIGRSHVTTSVLDPCCGLPGTTSYESRMEATDQFALDFVIDVVGMFQWLRLYALTHPINIHLEPSHGVQELLEIGCRLIHIYMFGVY